MKWDHSLPSSGMDCVNPEYHMLTEIQPLPAQRRQSGGLTDYKTETEVVSLREEREGEGEWQGKKK